MSNDLLNSLVDLETEGGRAIDGAQTADELERLRVELLGRKGRLTAILRGLGQLTPELRPRVGAEANRVKEALSARLDERMLAMQSGNAARTGPGIDLTMPGRAHWRGGVHPVTIVVDEICEIFRDLGFARVQGPEAETVEYNFEKLNTPLDHPAADMHDTFFLGEGIVLRTHTSPMQARVMEEFAPPVRVVVPGTVYRRDSFDASHAPGFEQLEGLAVDEGITFVDFKATISEFARRFFGPGTKTRFRPSYFPFTEPSAEVDVSCQICEGAGCSACKRTGWMEIMGAGMVDPAVFEAVGYDPEKYTGFAFGMGPARIAMQRYRIPDIRLFYENDVRFLEQFG
ncbi:MAG TPA: phenylalanine--tRNA ligase subunit alpha [Longimicrobiaceae bacterium]|nr:phenylalanine--tRNA ligase subunit alpha [Longimicrobiaceae bacterium]